MAKVRDIYRHAVVERSVVERTARILGPLSSAARALKAAAEIEANGDNVTFVTNGRTLGTIAVPNAPMRGEG